MIILNRGEHIGHRLQQLRLKAGLSQSDAGRNVQLFRAGVSKRERRRNITLDVLIEHVAGLGYSVALVPASSDYKPRYSTEEFAVEYELLRSEGYNRRQIAQRLGTTRHAVDQAYLRATRKGLLTPDRRTA